MPGDVHAKPGRPKRSGALLASVLAGGAQWLLWAVELAAGLAIATRMSLTWK